MVYPLRFWESYSAFANCYGGVIFLDVIENADKTWRTTGLCTADEGKLRKDFWDTINNPKKVNMNLLREEDVETYEEDGDLIIVIQVPMAKREFWPIYIDDKLFGGTFRRNWEGDYRCTSSGARKSGVYSGLR